MKILMVLDHEFPSDIRVEKEIETLQTGNHIIDIACYTMTNRDKEEIYPDFRVFRKPISKFIYKSSVGALNFPFYFNFWQSFLEELIKKENYDTIHIHDLPLAKPGYKLAQKYKLKFVLDLHENWPVLMDLSEHTKTPLGRILNNNRQWRNYEIKYSNLADGLVVVAPEMKERLRKNGMKNQNIAVVPNTSKTDTFDFLGKTNPDPNYLTLLYTGGLTIHRGVQIALKGLKKIDLDENFRFLIVGSGRYEPELKKLTKKLELEKFVTFLGWQSQEKVFELIAKCNIALIPHLKSEHTDNTSPNKLFHYMLASKPVLATDCNYLERILETSGCGLIYYNDNSDDFALKLHELLNSPTKRKTMGENGYNSVKKRFNWEMTSKPLLQLYQFGNPDFPEI